MIKSGKAIVAGFLTFLVLFFGSEIAEAQQKKEVAAKVEEVTVFLNRAQVTNSARASVPAGVSEIALTNVAGALDVNSIQVSARGNVIVTGVQFSNNYLQTSKTSKITEAVTDSLTYYQNLIRSLRDQNEVYQKEEAMVVANQSIGGQKGVAVEDLEEVADFFRKRLFSVRANIRNNDFRLMKANEISEKFRNQLIELHNARPDANGVISVFVSAEKAAVVNLEISYVVYNAGWVPRYDLRATNTKSPVKLAYKAGVFQNTGVDWHNVKLTLATTNPSAGASKPELTPWYVSIPDRLRKQEVAKRKSQPMYEREALTADEKSPGAAEDADDSWGSAETTASTMAGFTETFQTELSVSFQIKMPYTIPADNKPIVVDIQESELPANYVYATVPKLENAAFLMARLTNWEQYNLLPGEASIYFENTFTGKTIINPALSDTLTFSLGRDKKVMVQHEKVKEMKSKSFLGNSTKQTHGYQLTIRNAKDQPIVVTVEDQIPVSGNSEVEVELMESSGGVLDKTTGKVKWEVTLNPSETKKLALKFSVKHPKNQPIIGL